MAAFASLVLVLPLLCDGTGESPCPPVVVQPCVLFDAWVAEFCAARDALALSHGTPGRHDEPPELLRRFLPQMRRLADEGHAPASAWILRHFDPDPHDACDVASVKLALYQRLLPEHAGEAWLAAPELDVLTSLECDRPLLAAPTTSALARALFEGVPHQDVARRLRALTLEAGALARLGESDPAQVAAASAVWTRELARDPHGPLAAACEKALWRLRHLVRGREVPDFVAADVDDNEIRLSDFRGKVVVVAFFSLEGADDPSLVAGLRSLAREFEGAPVALLGVDQDSNQVLFRRLWEQSDLRVPCVFEGGRRGRVAGAWRLDAPPRALVIDREGRLRGVDLQAAALEHAVRQLACEPTLAAANSTPRPPRRMR